MPAGEQSLHVPARGNCLIVLLNDKWNCLLKTICRINVINSLYNGFQRFSKFCYSRLLVLTVHFHLYAVQRTKTLADIVKMLTSTRSWTDETIETAYIVLQASLGTSCPWELQYRDRVYFVARDQLSVGTAVQRQGLLHHQGPAVRGNCSTETRFTSSPGASCPWELQYRDKVYFIFIRTYRRSL